jgi:hypothetical protein
MKRSTVITTAVGLVAVFLAILELSAGAGELRACTQLETGWRVFNLLQSEQALRVIAWVMSSC